MSLPPPDYNPSVSVLHGGTAPILPVMGGGGMPPPDYNASESVLAVGGTSPPIVAVSGGGGQSDDPTEPSSDTLNQAPKLPVQIEVYQPYEDFKAETYKKKYIQTLKKNLKSSGDWRNELQKLISSYRNYSTEYWGPKPTLPKGRNQNSIQPDKLFQTIPKSVKKIILICSVNGEVNTFLKFSQFLYTQGYFENLSTNDLTLKKDICIVLHGDYFTKNTTENPSLLYLFLKIKISNLNTFFLLRSSSEDESIGIDFNSLEKNSLEERFLLNFLSPSYIIYDSPIDTYDGIVFTNEKTIVKKKSGDIADGNEIEEDTTYTKYYTLKVKSDISEKEGPNPQCDILKDLHHSLETFVLDSRYITFIRPNVSKSNPLICLDEKGVQHSPFISRAFRSGELDDKFEKASKQVKLLIDGKAYSIRVTNPIGGSVKNNWELGIFSKSEAEFLNDLDLSPELLYRAFGEDWKSNLAEFIEHVSSPDYFCYSNVSIIPSRVCDHTRDFINKVIEERYKEEIEKDVLKNISSEEPGTWPEEFKQISIEVFKKNPLGKPFKEGDITKINLIIVSDSGKSGLFQYEVNEGDIREKIKELRTKYKQSFEILE